MTIQGAMKELVNLLNADDIPIYYKGGIKKVIETIDDYVDGKDDYIKRMADRKDEPQTAECPFDDAIPCEWACTEYGKCKYKTEPTISKMEQVDKDINVRSKDEPQTDAVGVPMAFIDEAKFKAHCLNCQRDVADIKCLDCDGDKYFLPDEPQTERSE